VGEKQRLADFDATVDLETASEIQTEPGHVPLANKQDNEVLILFGFGDEEGWLPLHGV
jgi:hypothetical protein